MVDGAPPTSSVLARQGTVSIGTHGYTGGLATRHCHSSLRRELATWLSGQIVSKATRHHLGFLRLAWRWRSTSVGLQTASYRVAFSITSDCAQASRASRGCGSARRSREGNRQVLSCQALSKRFCKKTSDCTASATLHHIATPELAFHRACSFSSSLPADAPSSSNPSIISHAFDITQSGSIFMWAVHQRFGNEWTSWQSAVLSGPGHLLGGMSMIFVVVVALLAARVIGVGVTVSCIASSFSASAISIGSDVRFGSRDSD